MDVKTVDDIQNPGLEDKVHYPPAWFGNGSIEEQRNNKIEEIEESCSSVDTVLLSDSDTDGMSTAALIRKAVDSLGIVINGHGSLLEMSEVLELINENADEGFNLFMCDLMPDEEEFDDVLEELSKVDGNVEIFDHHQWSEEQLEKISRVSDNVDIRPDEEVCTANIVFERFRDEYSERQREKYEEMVEVVRDHDIWVKEDPRSDDMSDFHQNSEEERFMRVLEEKGADFMQDDDVRELVESARLEQRKKVEYQVKAKTQWYEVFKLEDGLAISMKENYDSLDNEKADNNITVAVSYGSAYRSQVGNVLCEGFEEGYDEELDISNNSDTHSPGDADLAVVVLPYNKVSLRSTEEFGKCDVIAGNLGGGGHEQAAGFKPDIVGRKISYEQHIEEEGETVREKVLSSITRMIENGNLDI